MDLLRRFECPSPALSSLPWRQRGQQYRFRPLFGPGVCLAIQFPTHGRRARQMSTKPHEQYGYKERSPHKVIRSPRETLLPYISKNEASKLAYPPNLMPGERDVITPYGTMRVNEWGPENGRKVLFVHGDATPSPIFSRIAHGLSKRGCRVMLLDLWGRGYTDAPLNCDYDARLYSSQLLYAVASSPLSWTTGDGFSMIGFSLGGGLTVDFASTFPQFVNSIVLMAPGGMLRRVPEGYDSEYIRHPERAPSADFMSEMVSKMLEVELNNPRALDYASSKPFSDNEKPQPPVQSATWEPPELSMAGLIQWQWDYHKGIVEAITNTARNGPIQWHYDMWRRLAEIYTGKTKTESALTGSQLMMILGDQDVITDAKETRSDALRMLPEKHLEFVNLPDGHGFVYSKSDEIVENIARFWNLA